MSTAKKKTAVPPIPAVREAVFSLVESDVLVMRSAILGGSPNLNIDRKLSELVCGLGQLAAAQYSAPVHLRNLFGFTFGWLRQLRVNHAFNLIHQERERQEQMFRDGTHDFTCSCHTVSFFRKLRVLTEEVGEVAQAIELVEKIDNPGRRQHLLDELIQVAAVLVAWLETQTKTTPTKGTK